MFDTIEKLVNNCSAISVTMVRKTQCRESQKVEIVLPSFLDVVITNVILRETYLIFCQFPLIAVSSVARGHWLIR